jgi:hypothetical protein
MKSRTRKILSRIGAGLMLGLSLLNFGSAWGKRNAAQVPKRYRRLKEKEQEKLRLKNQKLMTIAETEAQKAIAQEDVYGRRQAHQANLPNLTLGQKIFRYVIITSWVISSSVFFTSMVFNYPFAWGRGALSLLPGVPHTTKLYLVPEKKTISAKEEMKIDLKMDAPYDQVGAVKATIHYNPQKIYLIRYEKKMDEKTDWQVQIDEKNGEIIVFLEKKDLMGEVFRKKTLASFYFASTTKENKKVKIELIQNQSLVLAKKDGKSVNVLGKVEAGRFYVIAPN